MSIKRYLLGNHLPQNTVKLLLSPSCEYEFRAPSHPHQNYWQAHCSGNV